MATVAPPARDDNLPHVICCPACGFEVPHASVAGRGNADIDVEDWLSLCQRTEAAQGRPWQCPELTAAQNWPVRLLEQNATTYSGQERLLGGEPVLVTLPPQEFSDLDAWIERLPEPKPSRAEAICRLVEEGLRPGRSN